MGPTYATGDPMALNYSGDGLVMEVTRDDRIGNRVPVPHPDMVVSNPGNPRRMAMRGYGAIHEHPGYMGFGQTETDSLPQVYASEDLGATSLPSVGTGILDSLGNAFSNIIRTIGYQAPGLITGQPVAGQYYPTGYVPTAGQNMMPLLLIGGGIALVWYLSKKR